VAAGGVLVALKLSNGQYSMLGAGDATLFSGKRSQQPKRTGSRTHMSNRYEYVWVAPVFLAKVCLFASGPHRPSLVLQGAISSGTALDITDTTSVSKARHQWASLASHSLAGEARY
jgi:hypothetical protein